ncbi:MAG TPA: ATP-binding protein [Oligoflexus sp.]|uniref:two-component system sensor histidine kinase NtrB n=1 Tax=Oligoflexus sp. TaxID=1971216 RepID=UPI002D259943|nr:ATP-binding protein [Oligoflexus sp.]HYX37499.1 ATP-binding protein [Oligoflexus sp.]
MHSWKLEDILLRTPILCFVIDKDERLVLLNGGLGTQLGLKADEVIGTPAFKIAALPIKRSHFRKAFGGHSFSITLSVQGSSYETTLQPMQQNGEIQAVLGMTQDMTKHLQMEQFLDDERHRLLASQRLNSLAGIASGLAHEINNPLAIISGYAEQLHNQAQKGQLSDDRLLFSTSKIVEACRRCHAIIESLKHFARDGSHDAFETCSVNDIVSVALQLSEQTFHAMGVKLYWQPLLNDVNLQGRRLQLIQALFNVLANACEASLQVKEPKVSIQALDHGDRASIEVMDNGPGIPESLRVKIFEPFFTTKDQMRSVGVGLSTAKGMIEEHEGRISFISSPGATCFSISLPKVPTRTERSAS